MKKSNLFLSLALLSLTGAAVSAFQTSHFFDVRVGLQGFKSFCSFGTHFNCEAVESSRFAELIPNFPLAAFAGSWYIGILFLSGMAFFKNESRRDTVLTLRLMSVTALLFSLVYLAIMAFVLKTYCLLCLGVDAINVLLVGISFFGLKACDDSSSSFPFKKTVLVSACCFLAGFPFAKALESQAAFSDADLNQIVETVVNRPKLKVSNESTLKLGSDSAPVKIVKFSDLQCPSCRRAAYILHPLLKLYPNEVQFIYRNFPLSNECNGEVNSNMHPASCEAAKVLLCSQKLRGQFEPLYEAIFDGQESLVPGKPIALAAELGFKKEELETCMKSEETRALLAKDIAEGKSLKIESTPTFFINGRRVEGALPAPALRQIIDRLSKE